jgi:phenylalanyl-tRNA synthetase beta chain
MRAPLSWLREFTPVEAPVEEIARALSFLGLVVEGTEVVGPPLPGIVVARVLATRSHPAADRIQLVDVDTGNGTPLQICCGAFNMKEGDLVPLATIGTVMPNGLEISRRKLRGEWSNGMLCSAPELGIGPEGPTPAIFLLPAGSAAPGEPVADALGFGPDVIFDLEISPNRSDCFSIAGIARDLAAGMRLPFSLPVPPHVVDPDVERANVRVEDAARSLCRRFTGTVIEGVPAAVVAPFVARRLTLAGMRPISPVVDVSNYVMLELGQPNHPYDLDRLAGRGLVVRRGGEGEEIVTLDGTARWLTADDCVIADAEGGAVGIGGIMGGAEAEISAQTTTVLLEAANFDPHAVSATGKRLGLLSEARTRFERGVDIEVAGPAIDRFVELLGPSVRRGETSDLVISSPRPVHITLRSSRANAVLGTALRPEECAEFLTPLGFDPVAADNSTYDVKVPTWRPDCTREIDLIEEVARIYGYDNITRSLPSRPTAAVGLTDYQRGRRRVRELLAGAGSNEAWTNTFLSDADLSRAGLDPSIALEVENPLDRSERLLRTSLLPGLLSAARFNIDRQAGAFSLFELGSVFRHAPADYPGALVDGVMEWEQLGLVALGQSVDSGYAARMWEVVVAGLRLEGPSLGRSNAGGDRPGGDRIGRGAAAIARSLHPARQAALLAGGRELGVAGELAREVADRYDLKGRVAVVMIDLTPLLEAPRRSWAARPISRYPAVDLDMAFLVDNEVTAAELEATVWELAGDLAESVALFDVWRDSSLGEGRRSLAFRARLRALDRTLTEDEVATVRDRVAGEASRRHGAVLRSE